MLQIYVFFAVFDILLRYTEIGTWKDVFIQVIPKRKQVPRLPSLRVKPYDCSEVSAENKHVASLLPSTTTSMPVTDNVCISDTQKNLQCIG